ncbi:MAG: MarR family transcriptional regulator [Sphingomonadales bacterium]|nr:MAG: MarR family transcriptional regulator [Sphingomonadales bacterium]
MELLELDHFDQEKLARLRAIFGRIGRLLRQQREPAGSELTYQQLGTLFLIEKMQPVTPGELARTENVSRPTMTQFLNSLEANGLVSRVTGHPDGRARRVVLTERGVAACGDLRESRNRWLAERLAGLTRRQQRDIALALPALENLIDGDS